MVCYVQRRHPMNARKVRVLELLGAELRAIEFWDAEYCGKSEPEDYEKIAFSLRKKRRNAIIRQMVVLTRKSQRSRIRPC